MEGVCKGSLHRGVSSLWPLWAAETRGGGTSWELLAVIQGEGVGDGGAPSSCSCCRYIVWHMFRP